MKKQQLVPIGAFSEITEVSIKSLRYYDKIGVLPPAYVDPDTSYRYYTFQQARTVEIIKFCVELGIPLKRFPEFTEKDSKRIQFSEILEEGTALATEKIKSIQNKLELFEEIKDNIERSEYFKKSENSRQLYLQEKDFLVCPFDDSQEENEYFNSMNEMYEEILSTSIEPGYDFGKLLLFHQEKWRSFLFIEIKIKETPLNYSSNILHLPAQKYICTAAKSDSLSDAPAFFKAKTNNIEQRIFFEIEMFSSIYDTENPMFEWYCSAPMKIQIPPNLVK